MSPIQADTFDIDHKSYILVVIKKKGKEKQAPKKIKKKKRCNKVFYFKITIL